MQDIGEIVIWIRGMQRKIMGCICSKGFLKHEKVENQKKKEKGKSSMRFFGFSKREEIVIQGDGGGNVNDNGTGDDIDISIEMPTSVSRPLSQENTASIPVRLDGEEQKVLVANDRAPKIIQRRATIHVPGNAGERHLSRIISMPNGIKGAQVAAGWPPWLTAVAGEAIKGWIPRRADSFEKLEKIGQGTYSNVYRARDLDSGKIVALKKVRFVNMDPESVRFMAREIYILRKLDHPNVVKLEGLITSRMSSSLYLILEYMEHDLAGLAASLTTKFSEPQIKCYMQQLLRGLEHCHSRGVLHRDIKGSNLLIDNDGVLKITDFGLATTFVADQEQTMTSRVVTLWYRPPELLLGATEYGVAVDLWSSGCILAELLAGKPIMPGRTEVEQLHKIFKLCGSPAEDYWKKSKLPHATIFKPQQPYKRCIAETFKGFPSSSVALMDVLLAIEPERRGSAASALKHEFFTTKPLPCDPSTLPKYAPSKEFDAKRRNEEAKRQKASAKGRGSESRKRDSRESKGVQETDPNAPAMLQAWQERLKRSQNEKCNSQDTVSSFPIDPQGPVQNAISHSGALFHPSSLVSSWTKKVKETATQRSQGTADMSNISGLVASRISAQLERNRSVNGNWPGQQCDKWTDYLSRPASSHKKVDKAANKESMTGYGSKKSRIHHSGPLMTAGGNIEEMLKEHERHIQEAVRKARLDKVKSRD